MFEISEEAIKRISHSNTRKQTQVHESKRHIYL